MPFFTSLALPTTLMHTMENSTTFTFCRTREHRLTSSTLVRFQPAPERRRRRHAGTSDLDREFRGHGADRQHIRRGEVSTLHSGRSSARRSCGGGIAKGRKNWVRRIPPQRHAGLPLALCWTLGARCQRMEQPEGAGRTWSRGSDRPPFIAGGDLATPHQEHGADNAATSTPYAPNENQEAFLLRSVAGPVSGQQVRRRARRLSSSTAEADGDRERIRAADSGRRPSSRPSCVQAGRRHARARRSAAPAHRRFPAGERCRR